MSLSAMALFLLLMQNAGPQQSTASASIEGIAIKAGTNEPLSRVAVKLAPLPSPVTTTIPSPIPGAAMSPNVASTVPTESRAATLLAGARGSNQRTVTTAADGRFLFENLNPGTYQMSAISPGYAPTEYGQRGPNGHGLSITVKAGQKMQNLTLSLTPAGSLRGRRFGSPR